MTIHTHGQNRGNPSRKRNARSQALQRVLLGSDLNPAGRSRTTATPLTQAAVAARKRRKVRT